MSLEAPLVSIIIPVYNVEKYLKKCLDSVLGQTLTNIEIIAINNNSVDSSEKILEEYSKKDLRITVINEMKPGAACARNAGVRIAKGKYLGFVDSDDFVSPNMFEKMFQSAEQNNSDVVLCLANCYSNKTGKNLNSPYFNNSVLSEKFDSTAFSFQDIKPLIFKIQVITWNKIIKRSFWSEQGVYFPEGIIFEDNPVHFKLLFNASRMSLVREKFYNYRIHTTTSVTDKMSKRYDDAFVTIETLIYLLKEKNIYDDFRYELAEYVNWLCEYYFRELKGKYKERFFLKWKQFMQEDNLWKDLDFKKLPKNTNRTAKAIQRYSYAIFYLMYYFRYFMYKGKLALSY